MGWQTCFDLSEKGTLMYNNANGTRWGMLMASFGCVRISLSAITWITITLFVVVLSTGQTQRTSSVTHLQPHRAHQSSTVPWFLSYYEFLLIPILTLNHSLTDMCPLYCFVLPQDSMQLYINWWFTNSKFSEELSISNSTGECFPLLFLCRDHSDHEKLWDCHFRHQPILPHEGFVIYHNSWLQVHTQSD